MTPIVVDGGEGARVHVLIIGVGEYPACRSGRHKGTVGSLLRGISTLTCAPLSARRVAEWFLNADWTGSSVPLGTVDVLISPPGKALKHAAAPGGEITPARATFENVQAAWRSWTERCATSAENIALLYFCGHGWGGQQKYLLVEDFGDGAVWSDKLIDFTATATAMSGCRALTQCFFLDSCSSTPQELVGANLAARSLVGDDLMNDIRAGKGVGYLPDSLVVASSAPWATASASPGQPTQFAESLVRTLEGLGACREGLGPWQIQADYIVARMRAVLKWEGKGGECCQLGHLSRATVIRTVNGAPSVPFLVACKPDAALRRAHWRLQCPQTGQGRDRTPSATKWRDETDAEIYDLSVTFPDGTFESQSMRASIFPPWFECTLDVDGAAP